MLYRCCTCCTAAVPLLYLLYRCCTTVPAVPYRKPAHAGHPRGTPHFTHTSTMLGKIYHNDFVHHIVFGDDLEWFPHTHNPGSLRQLLYRCTCCTSCTGTLGTAGTLAVQQTRIGLLYRVLGTAGTPGTPGTAVQHGTSDSTHYGTPLTSMSDCQDRCCVSTVFED